jgi:hypothetical protein
MKFWSCGPATDIRKKDPACLCWEPRIDKIELVSTAGRHGAGQYPRPLIMSRRGRRRKVNETQTGTPGA